MRNAYKHLVENSEGKRIDGRPWRRWEVSIKTNLKETEYGICALDSSGLGRWLVIGSCKHVNEPEEFINFSTKWVAISFPIRNLLYKLQYRRGSTIPRISAQDCPPRKCIVRQSNIWFYQRIIWRLPPLFIGMYFDRDELVTQLFHIWTSFKQLTTKPHFSARAGACYVTCRGAERSIRRDATIVLW